MRKIALTQNQVALVDDNDHERLNQFKWYAKKGSNTFYAARNERICAYKQKTIRMHQEVIGMPPKGLMPDHINGCGTDNRRKNLRFVTNRQNMQNNIKHNGTSKYPGVGWFKRDKKWRAKIEINGKSKHLGLFTDEIKAFEAYKQAVNDLGEKMVGDTT